MAKVITLIVLMDATDNISPDLSEYVSPRAMTSRQIEEAIMQLDFDTAYDVYRVLRTHFADRGDRSRELGCKEHCCTCCDYQTPGIWRQHGTYPRVRRDHGTTRRTRKSGFT